MIKVYIASKLKHADRWRKLREQWPAEGIDLHARWHDQESQEDEAQPVDFSIFWLVDEEDVSNSDCVIVYGEADDKLNGALVEAGIAIAHKILVIVVGDSPSFGSWWHHPGVLRAGSLEQAKRLILNRFGPSRK